MSDDAKQKAAAWERHLWEIYESFNDDTPEAYLQGFIRAIEEGAVNLHYYIDGVLPRYAAATDKLMAAIERLTPEMAQTVRDAMKNAEGDLLT